MRVYHFMPSHFALGDLALERVKVARIEELNDPFDFISADFTDTEFAEALERTRAKLSEGSGILCFSKSYRNPLLWSHYADGHRGICLGFDATDQLLRPVKYQTERLKIPRERYFPEMQLTNEEMLGIIETKYIGWSYEEEVRLYVSLDHSTAENGLYFKEFDTDLALREIILGVRNKIPKTVVSRLTARIDQTIAVHNSKLAAQSFEVEALD